MLYFKMALRRKSLPAGLTYDYTVPHTKPAWWRKMGFSLELSDIITDETLERRRLIAALSHSNSTKTGISFVSHDGLYNPLRYNDICILKPLGKGAYSSVYEAMYTCKTSSGKITQMHPSCALKYITSKDIASRDILIEMIVHAYVSKILNSDEVPRLIRVGYCIDKKLPFVLMETLTGGMSLGDVLKSSEFTIAQKSFIVMDVMKKLTCIFKKLHAIKFVHSDLHPDNVYVRLTDGKVDSVAILDFGLSSMQIGRTRVGSKCAFVPEFNPTIDLEFLAYTILILYSESISKDLYRTLYKQSREIIDEPGLDGETWGPALVALHALKN